MRSRRPGPYLYTLAVYAMSRPGGHRWFRWRTWVITSYGAPRWA